MAKKKDANPHTKRGDSSLGTSSRNVDSETAPRSGVGANRELARMFRDMAYLYEINSVSYKPAAYRKAAKAVEELEEDLGTPYREKGLKGVEAIRGIGKSTASKIEEYLKKGKIASYEELKEKTALREIVTHFFETKGVPLDKLKMNSRKQRIVYARYVKPAKELLELAGSVDKAKGAIDKVAAWANSRNLDYAIETVAKKWLELDRLKPKEVVKKPFYKGDPMVWSEAKKKWFVVTPEGEWLEFADSEDSIEWRIAS